MFDLHLKYLTSGESTVVCLQRENAVKKLLDVLGPTDPRQARRESTFLWRATFGTDPINNALYCSASYRDAVDDQRVFFPHGLCCSPTVDLAAECIPCPAVDPLIESYIAKPRHAFSKKQHKHDGGPSGACRLLNVFLVAKCFLKMKHSCYLFVLF